MEWNQTSVFEIGDKIRVFGEIRCSMRSLTFWILKVYFRNTEPKQMLIIKAEKMKSDAEADAHILDITHSRLKLKILREKMAK